MQRYSDYNPITVFVHFFATMLICMFTLNPIVVIITAIGGILLNFAIFGFKEYKRYLFYAALFSVYTVINPIFSHKGATVLLFINDIPITLQSLVYGGFSALLIVSVLIWFKVFTDIFSSDKIMYIISRISKKAALIISMAIRFIPLFLRKYKSVRQSLKAVGKYNTDNIIDRIKSEISVFDIVLSSVIENGIITADSMSARGYDTNRRSSFYPFYIKRSDVVFIAVTVFLFFVTVIFLKDTDTAFYPYFSFGNVKNAGYFTYSVMAFLPFFLELIGSTLWKLYQSKI